MRTNLSIDELDVMRALGVAVTSPVLGTRLVAGRLGHPTISVHGNEVEGSVKTAREVGHVNVERELLASQIEHFVLGVRSVHEIDTRADVFGVGAVGDELQSETVSGCGNTIGAAVICAVKGTVGSAGFAIGAERGIPLIASVAVG